MVCAVLYVTLHRITGRLEECRLEALLRCCAVSDGQGAQGRRAQSRPLEKSLAMATRTTAPTVAAARLKRNPPPQTPSLVKIHPPRSAPMSPRITLAMQPKPRPREIFPAIHPASRPITIQPTREWLMWKAYPRIMALSSLFGLLLSHAV